MVGAWDESAEGGQPCQTLYLTVDSSLILAQRRFVHTADAEHSVSVFLARRLKLVSPRAYFYREHCVNAVLKPCREELFGHSVAVERYHVNAVLVAEVVSLFVVLRAKLVEYVG